MRAIIFVVASLSCAGNARRLQASGSGMENTRSTTGVAAVATPDWELKNMAPHDAGETNEAEPEKTPGKALAMMLAASNPTAAFSPSARRASLSRPAVSSSIGRTQMQAGYGSPNAPNMAPKFDVRDMPGVSAPLGFFDPLGYTKGASEGKVRFYREVELKHGRLAMLATLGFLVGEQIHPMFGGKIDVPSLVAFQETPLQKHLLTCFATVGIPEILSIFTFYPPTQETWAIRADYEAGNLGFDPLGLRPETAEGFKGMQTRELNNGRLAMIAIVGMIGQEMATGQKLFR